MISPYFTSRFRIIYNYLGAFSERFAHKRVIISNKIVIYIYRVSFFFTCLWGIMIRSAGLFVIARGARGFSSSIRADFSSCDKDSTLKLLSYGCFNYVRSRPQSQRLLYTTFIPHNPGMQKCSHSIWPSVSPIRGANYVGEACSAHSSSLCHT